MDEQNNLTPQQMPEIPTPPVDTPAPPTPPVDTPTPEPTPAPQKPKKSAKKLIITILIILLVLGLAGGTFWFGMEQGWWFKSHRSGGGSSGGSDSDSTQVDSAMADSGVAVEMAEEVIVEEIAMPEEFGEEVAVPVNTGIQRLSGSGQVDKYPIRMELVVDYDNNLVSGRYAYESTLRKYGDTAQAWFPFKGAIYGEQVEYSAYYQGDIFETFDGVLINGVELAGQTYNYNTGEIFSMRVSF